MEFVVLGLLMIRGLTIYELNQTFKQGISLFYSASYGSLQGALKKLLAKGWITYQEEMAQGRHKKVYIITAEGQAAFLNWMTSEAEGSKLEVTALSKLFFLGLIEDAAVKQAIVGDLVDRIEKTEQELAAMEKQLKQTPIPAEYDGIMKYQLKTLEYGIHSHGFAKAWFQRVLEELRHQLP